MPQDNESSELLPHVTGPVAATVVSHPFRVAMTLSVYHNGVKDLINTLRPQWYKGLGINLLDSCSAVILQSWLKERAEKKLGENTPIGRFAGIGTATAVGMAVSTFVETPFIRKATRQSITPQPAVSLFRYSRELMTFYFLREACFSATVFGDAKSHSSGLYYSLLFLSTGASAICQKYATLEATADIQNTKEGTTPNFSRDGIIRTLKNLAKGNHYTHHSYRVRFKNPKSWQLAYNLLSVSSGGTFFLSRLLYIGVFSEFYHLGVEAAPLIQNNYQFRLMPQKRIMLPDEQATSFKEKEPEKSENVNPTHS